MQGGSSSFLGRSVDKGKKPVDVADSQSPPEPLPNEETPLWEDPAVPSPPFCRVVLSVMLKILCIGKTNLR